MGDWPGGLNESPHLVEAVFAPIADVNHFNDLGRQTLIEHVAHAQLRLEISTTCQHQPCYVHLICGDEVLDGQFGDFAHIVVSLLVAQTGETQSRLTATTVFLRKIDSELVNNLSSVSCDCSEEGTVSVHDNESEL